jgi:SAM-dependent methyltransferase
MEDLSPPTPVHFNKYDEMGAYHWVECDRSSRRYNPPLEARYQIVLKKLEDGGRVLDVGCGDGFLTGLVSPICTEVFGIDTEFAGVKQAALQLQKRQNCMVTQASCYQMPFDDGMFDYACLADVFEHLEYPAVCIKEIKRVLSTEGVLLLTTPKWRPDRKWDERHYKEYTPEELTAMLAGHFSHVTLTFFWPRFWSRMYSTRVGWRAIRLWARYLNNPFLQEGSDAQRYGQIFAFCSEPR